MARIVKPHMMYTEVHNAAYMTLAEGLVGLGLLKGSAADAVAAGAMTMLMPHGLGHGLGMDVHDCEAIGERSFDYGSIAERAAESGTCVYRAAWRIEPGTVMTDEPGLYFIPALIDKCRAEGKYKGIVDYDALEAYRDFGGIRIEDDILVTESGSRIIGDIAKLPHVLIAGPTGSGKSVCTNSLIVSMLYKSTPEEVRFIMVDPKMVELAPYNGIPHLLIPVVTDPKKAAGALQWAVFEMMKRYKLFSENGVKELSAYNALADQAQPDENGEKMKKLPTVVVVIDELADLMLVAAKEVEDSICRVAQMGRAAGMHLVIATQRPSADVITGLMKANIPSRIAFAVASSMESRIILDTPGAEKLVGKGDMLYAPLGEGKPRRVQGWRSSGWCIASRTQARRPTPRL